MATRMQRYYNSQEASSRSQRNKELYKDIYEYGQYSNIEGIASIGKANEIDITKVKEMLNGREKYQKRREYHKTFDDEPAEPFTKNFEEPEEERNYDIRDILVKARETQPKDDKERVLRDSKYEFLTKLTKQKNQKEEEEDLKELINTITSTSMLNKLGDETLARELFSDLTSSDKNDEPKSLKEYIKEEKIERDNTNESSLDKSFFTSSLNLSKSDFVDEEEDEEKKTSVFSIIIIIILVIVILACIGILIYKRFM